MTQTGLHGLGTAKGTDLRTLPVDIVNSSWRSREKYGELFVWTGSRWKRYPPRSRTRGLRRHQQILEEAQFDLKLIEEGDAEYLCLVAVWAFQSRSRHETKSRRRGRKRSKSGNGHFET